MAVQNEAPLQAAAPRAERGQARVSVRVQDVNEAPVFQENPLRTSLPEGVLPGTPVATFSAQDPDTEQLQRLRWGTPGVGGPRGRREGATGPFVYFPARSRSIVGFPSVLWPVGRGLICLCASLRVHACVHVGVNLCHTAGLGSSWHMLMTPICPS